MCNDIQHGTDEYQETVALRAEVLRTPLGLIFTPSELAEESDSFHLVCRRGRTLVACLVLQPQTAGPVRLRQMAVRSEFRGQGIGRALVRYAESFARTHGYQEIVLHARETAVGFYEKAGYQIVGDRFIEVTVPHFTMRKSLANSG